MNGSRKRRRRRQLARRRPAPAPAPAHRLLSGIVPTLYEVAAWPSLRR